VPLLIAFKLSVAFSPCQATAHSLVEHDLTIAPIQPESAAANAPFDPSIVHQNAHGSKEELFGLLGVLNVVLVPCLDFTLRYFIAKYCSVNRRWGRHLGELAAGFLEFHTDSHKQHQI
jgi:hypothetical protein